MGWLLPCRLDVYGRCYLEPRDWGSPGALRLVEQFSLMYLRKHMGFPNPTSSPEQVNERDEHKSMHASMHPNHPSHHLLMLSTHTGTTVTWCCLLPSFLLRCCQACRRHGTNQYWQMPDTLK
jgi:hypothetical protein